LLSKGKDVSQEWLEKARAGMIAANQAASGTSYKPEERESLIGSQMRTGSHAQDTIDSARPADEDEASGSDSEVTHQKTVQERRRELERLRTDNELGWARLE
jgi:hypothetical protein